MRGLPRSGQHPEERPSAPYRNQPTLLVGGLFPTAALGRHYSIGFGNWEQLISRGWHWAGPSSSTTFTPPCYVWIAA